MKLLTATKGTPHLTSVQFRTMLEGICGSASYIMNYGNKLNPILAANNVIEINSGLLFHHGGVFLVEENTRDEVSCENGTQGMKRIDLIVARYELDASTGVETESWRCIKGEESTGTPTMPECTIGNMQEGDMVDECPVFAIYLDGLNVTKIETLLDVMPCMGELNDDVVLWSGDNTSSGTLTLSDDLFKYNRVVFMLDNAVVYEIPVVKGMTVAGDASVRKERDYDVEVCDLVVSNISSESIKISSYSRGFMVNVNRFKTGPVYIDKIIGKH